LMNEYNKALPYLLRSLNYNKEHYDVNQTMRLLIDVAKIHLARPTKDSTFTYVYQALNKGKETGARQVVKDACKILSSMFDYLHRSDSAYFYYKQYRTINDSILNDQLKGRIAGFAFAKN
jgi:hypothetical protein